MEIKSLILGAIFLGLGVPAAADTLPTDWFPQDPFRGAVPPDTWAHVFGTFGEHAIGPNGEWVHNGIDVHAPADAPVKCPVAPFYYWIVVRIDYGSATDGSSVFMRPYDALNDELYPTICEIGHINVDANLLTNHVYSSTDVLLGTVVKDRLHIHETIGYNYPSTQLVNPLIFGNSQAWWVADTDKPVLSPEIVVLDRCGEYPGYLTYSVPACDPFTNPVTSEKGFRGIYSLELIEREQGNEYPCPDQDQGRCRIILNRFLNGQPGPGDFYKMIEPGKSEAVDDHYNNPNTLRYRLMLPTNDCGPNAVNPDYKLWLMDPAGNMNEYLSENITTVPLLSTVEVQRRGGVVSVMWVWAKPSLRATFEIYRTIGISGPETEVFSGENPPSDGDEESGLGVRYVWNDVLGPEASGKAWYRVVARYRGAIIGRSEPVEVDLDVEAGPIRMTGVAPNPTRGSIYLTFMGSGSGFVRLRVVDVCGRLRRDTMLPLEVGGSSVQGAWWDGKDSGGRSLESGLYFAVVDVGGVRSMKKFMVVR